MSFKKKKKIIVLKTLLAAAFFFFFHYKEHEDAFENYYIKELNYALIIRKTSDYSVLKLKAFHQAELVIRLV